MREGEKTADGRVGEEPGHRWRRLAENRRFRAGLGSLGFAFRLGARLGRGAGAGKCLKGA